MEKDTIAAISTGMQTTAIGIIRISGSCAIEAADKVFKPLFGEKMCKREDRKLVYGGVYDSDSALIDLCLCTVSRAPNTYTGEDTAELQCHGSPVVLQTVLTELFKYGVRQARPGEFTKRAFLNGKMELTGAEAVADIIEAETIDEVRNAAGQLSGAIAVKMEEIYSGLTDICSHFHAILDYPDEDIEPFVIESYKNRLTGFETTLKRLSDSYDRGKMIKNGIKTVITGKPNAGKSSLLNALLGYDRAIVTDVPGTTRDTIEEKILFGGKCFRLIDTAGIRETNDIIEKQGVERSLRAVDNSDFVIAVFDGSTEFDSEDRNVLAAAEKAKKAVAVISKKDRTDYSEVFPDTSLPVVGLSSITGDGLDELESVAAELFSDGAAPRGEILTNSRQFEAVQCSLDYIRAAIQALEMGETPDIVLTEVEGALSSIGELSGKNIRDDITNKIFARFCVGK